MDTQLVLPKRPPLEKGEIEAKITLNSRLRALRKANGKKMRDVADFLGVSISTYAGYEASETKPNYREPALEKIVKLASYYGVSVDYLIGNSDIEFVPQSENIIEIIRADNNLDTITKQFLVASLTKYQDPKSASV